MNVPIVVPELGVPSAMLSLWFVTEGEVIAEGERVVEILAGAATFDVSAPVGGRLILRRAFRMDPLATGQVLGYIEVDVDC